MPCVCVLLLLPSPGVCARYEYLRRVTTPISEGPHLPIATPLVTRLPRCSHLRGYAHASQITYQERQTPRRFRYCLCENEKGHSSSFFSPSLATAFPTLLHRSVGYHALSSRLMCQSALSYIYFTVPPEFSCLELSWGRTDGAEGVDKQRNICYRTQAVHETRTRDSRRKLLDCSPQWGLCCARIYSSPPR
jgi:hypothetical protein